MNTFDAKSQCDDSIVKVIFGVEKQIRRALFEIGTTSRNELKMWMVRKLVSFEPLVNNKFGSRIPFWNIFTSQSVTSLLSSSSLSSSSTNVNFMRQLLVLVCQIYPKEVAVIFERWGELFRDFFHNNKNRISAWFDHFSFDEPAKLGAVALEHHIFYERDFIWTKLNWTGKRSYPPVIAAQKRHLLMELDVYHAVNNVLYEEKSFWDSDSFQQTLSSGHFLSIDYSFFADILIKIIKDEFHGEKQRKRQAIFDLVEVFLKTQHFGYLCNHLSQWFEDADYINLFYRLLPKSVLNEDKASIEDKIYVHLCLHKWKDFNDLLFLNSLLCQAPLVLKLLLPEESDVIVDISYGNLLDDTSLLNKAFEASCKIVNRADFSIKCDLLSSISDDKYIYFIVILGFLLFAYVKKLDKGKKGVERVMKRLGLDYRRVFLDHIGQRFKRKSKRKKHVFVGWKVQSTNQSMKSTTFCCQNDVALFLAHIVCFSGLQQGK